MIVCGSCGDHEEDDSAAFCGACGAFLEFVGVRKEDPLQEPVADPALQPVPVGSGASGAGAPGLPAALTAWLADALPSSRRTVEEAGAEDGRDVGLPPGGLAAEPAADAAGAAAGPAPAAPVVEERSPGAADGSQGGSDPVAGADDDAFERTLGTRVRASEGAAAAAAAPAAVPTAAVPPAAVPPAAVPPAAVPPAAVPPAAAPPEARGPVAGPQLPAVAPPEQRSPEPPVLAPVLPGEEAALRAARRGPEAPVAGDLLCADPACGTRNVPTRSFCRRCGASLAPPVAPPHVSWWRRAWRAVRRWWRRRRRLDAGARPRRWGDGAVTPARARRRRPLRALGNLLASLLHLLVPALVVLTLVGMAVPDLRSRLIAAVGGAVADVRRVVAPQYVPVRPVRVEASSAVPGHPPEHAVDGVTTTHWAEAGDGTGAGAVLALVYDRPVDLRRIGVRLGASGSPEAFAQDPRPERLQLVAGDQVQEVLLVDTVDLQTVDVELDRVERLELRVVSVFSGQAGTAASLTEVTGFSVR